MDQENSTDPRERVLQHLPFQADACRNLGSPFNADLLDYLRPRLDAAGAVGARVLA